MIIGKVGFGGNINIMQIQHALQIHLGSNLFITLMELFNIPKFLLYHILMLTIFVVPQSLNHHHYLLIHLALLLKDVVIKILKYILTNRCIFQKDLLFHLAHHAHNACLETIEKIIMK
jgi:hypothetical protein